MIAVVVLLNSLVGAVQEGRAERSIASLRQLTSQQARVTRGQETRVMDARDLVPGDLVNLEAGDAVPADVRLLDGVALQVSEASLTGESVPVGKDPTPVAPEAALADPPTSASI